MRYLIRHAKEGLFAAGLLAVTLGVAHCFGAGAAMIVGGLLAAGGAILWHLGEQS